MKLLFIIRHGAHTDGHLNDKGDSQMAAMAAKLSEFQASGRFGILSSDAPRALESTVVLAKKLGDVNVQIHNAFWYDDNHNPDLEQAVDLIEQVGAEVDYLVVVTHARHNERLAVEYLGRLDLDSTTIRNTYRDMGQALIVDPSKGTAEDF
jgi:phosphohistidine phosphatase SixA